MTKKDIDFEKLELPKNLKVKKSETNVDADKAIKSIHDSRGEKEKTKRITIDLPFSIYVKVRKKVIEEEKTLKDYFLGLVVEELESQTEIGED